MLQVYSVIWMLQVCDPKKEASRKLKWVKHKAKDGPRRNSAKLEVILGQRTRAAGVYLHLPSIPPLQAAPKCFGRWTFQLQEDAEVSDATILCKMRT